MAREPPVKKESDTWASTGVERLVGGSKREVRSHDGYLPCGYAAPKVSLGRVSSGSSWGAENRVLQDSSCSLPIPRALEK